MIINGERWRILFVSSYHPALLISKGLYALGVCNDNNKTIYISLRLSKEKLKKVLCHEVVHAIMFSYNVYLTAEQQEVMADLITTFGQEIMYNVNKIFQNIN